MVMLDGIKNIEFIDEVIVVNKVVEELKKKGVKVIVVFVYMLVE